MSWSLSEVEGLARKASYGAGLSWGIAEEAGKAIRWLCAAGFPGGDALVALLAQNDGAAYETLCPADTAVSLWAAQGALCPLISGAALCDMAQYVAEGKDVQLSRVSQPMLLIPYVVIMADMNKTALSLSWDDLSITRNTDGTFLNDPDAQVAAAEAENVRIGLATTVRGIHIRRSYRAEIAPLTAEHLNRFAHRTYAPDTPESRLAGAGAGLSDND